MSAATGQRGADEWRTAGEEWRAGRAGREGGERAGAEVLEHISSYTRIQVYTYVYTYIHTYIYVYTHKYVYMYIRICTSKYVYAYIRIYVYVRK